MQHDCIRTVRRGSGGIMPLYMIRTHFQWIGRRMTLRPSRDARPFNDRVVHIQLENGSFREVIFTRNGGYVHAIECDHDHMHIMAELPTIIPVAFFLGSLKGNSAKFVQRESRDYLKQSY